MEEKRREDAAKPASEHEPESAEPEEARQSARPDVREPAEDAGASAPSESAPEPPPAGQQPVESAEEGRAAPLETEAAPAEAATGAVPVRAVVEALLFASSEPLSAARLSSLIGGVGASEVKRVLSELRDEYDRDGRGFAIEELAGGFLLLSRKEFAPFVQKLHRQEASRKLSQAALETLAIVAYRQPISRTDIEAIRGVQCGPVLQTLLDAKLIRVAGRGEGLGHPLLYGTTKRFLEVFGLASLKDLPRAEEMKKP